MIPKVGPQGAQDARLKLLGPLLEPQLLVTHVAESYFLSHTLPFPHGALAGKCRGNRLQAVWSEVILRAGGGERGPAREVPRTRAHTPEGQP